MRKKKFLVRVILLMKNPEVLTREPFHTSEYLQNIS